MLKIATNSKKLPNHSLESWTKKALFISKVIDKNKIKRENHTCLNSLLVRQNAYNTTKKILRIFRNIVIFNYFSLFLIFNSVDNN